MKGELQNFNLSPTFLRNFAMKSIQTIVVRTFSEKMSGKTTKLFHKQGKSTNTLGPSATHYLKHFTRENARKGAKSRCDLNPEKPCKGILKLKL